MPSRNIYKTYVEESFYHIYNRGVEKREIFLSEQDYKVFLKNLKTYLSKPLDRSKQTKNFTLQGTTFKGVPRQPKNYYKNIELLCFCLMPNHFHLLVKQRNKNDIQSFMKSITVKYSMYFNKKYNRVGQLFQGRYKAVIIKDDTYLLHLSRYIHLNPSEYTMDLIGAYSSFADFTGNRKTKWVKPEFILNFFNSAIIPGLKKYNSYRTFVLKNSDNHSDLPDNLTLEY